MTRAGEPAGDAAASPRGQRAREIIVREDVLRRVQSTQAHKRTRASQEQGREVPVSADEKAAGQELGALTRERRELLAQAERKLRREMAGLASERAIDGEQRVAARGPLWADIENAYRRWIDLGEPDRTRVGITAGAEDDHTMWLDEPETGLRTW